MDKNTIHTPASPDEATERLTSIDRVLRARHWERAAILATIVRLPGKPGPAPRDNRDSGYLTCEQYAQCRIPGLLDDSVIRLYVQRWLDQHGGQYPPADTDIELPNTPWPPVKNGNEGTRMPKTPEAIVAKAVEEHGAAAIAAALADTAEDEMLTAVERKAYGRMPAGGRPTPMPAMVPTFAAELRDLCGAQRDGLGRLGRLLDANTVEPGSDEERLLQHLVGDYVAVLGAYSVSDSVEKAMASWGDQ